MYENSKLEQKGLFYDSKVITTKEEELLKDFAINKKIDVYTLEEFREVFLDEVYDLETLCIGFNLPFDISRIALQASQGRLSYREGFSMQISKKSLLSKTDCQQAYKHNEFHKLGKATRQRAIEIQRKFS